MHNVRSRYVLTAMVILLWGWSASNARASSISFHVTNSNETTIPEGTVTFEGTVTNDSGVDLNASDFFFNFSGFDVTSVTPNQDLGVVTDFQILGGTTSGVVALFDVTLGLVAPGSSFPLDVALEDVNSDLSTTQTVTVAVPGGASVPEPATVVMLGTGITAVLVSRRKLCS